MRPFALPLGFATCIALSSFAPRALAVFCYGKEVPVCEYIVDSGGFIFDGDPGPLSLITFETLPDGSPSYAGADITSDFNYTS